MSGARARMLDRFRAIARERIDRLSHGIVELERHPDDAELAKTLLREIHTLKGESRMMGLTDMNAVTHRTEDVLHASHKLGFANLRDVSEVILRGLDLLGAMLAPDAVVDVGAFATAVDTALATPAAHTTPTPPASSASEPAPTAAPPTEPERKSRVDLRAAEATTLRVDLERLNHLTEIAGDLLLEQARNEQIFGDLDALGLSLATAVRRLRAGGSFAEIDALSRKFAALLAEAREQTFEASPKYDALEHTVRELRFLPIQSLFQGFPRTLRDLAKETGKSVRVQTAGGDVEVDKQVLDRLAEPLLHLTRNAIDHGIEAPEVRVRAGKSPEGTLTLHARQSGSSVEIEVRDDGSGVDLARVRARAVQQRILNPDELAGRTDAEVADLIFLPGFSTRDEVTDLSGRGVGLSAVRTEAHALGGAVSVESHADGTRFRLRVPISTVIGRVLLAEANGQLFAFPADAVVEVAELAPEDVEDLGHGIAWRRGDRRVVIADLGEVLGGRSDRADTSGIPVVVVRHDDEIVAFRVTRFAGEQQVVQRPVDPFVAGLRLAQGTVALAGGRLGVVLAVPELVRAAFRSRWRVDRGGSTASTTVLVVDDSEFTRDMIVSVLRGLGCKVVEAVNGQLGADAAARERPDLVITDLEMPVLDGFGLLRQLRSNPATATIPAVVFSTRGSDADKRLAADLGANAYLVKSEFREEELARVVRRFASVEP